MGKMITQNKRYIQHTSVTVEWYMRNTQSIHMKMSEVLKTVIIQARNKAIQRQITLLCHEVKSREGQLMRVSHKISREMDKISRLMDQK